MASSKFGKGYVNNEPGTSGVRKQRGCHRLMGTLMKQYEHQNE